MKFTITTFLLITILPGLTAAAEKRCGWVDNPTPGNWWITDKDDTWFINTQGKFQIDEQSMQHLNPSTKDYVKTNGNYGYYCACLTVDVDKSKKRVVKIYEATQLPISRCENDAALEHC